MRGGLFAVILLSACGARRTVVPEADADTDVDTDVDADVDADADSDTDSGSDACDLDGDRHLAPACGGDDCDDADASIHPGAPDDAWIVEVIVDDADFASEPSIRIAADGTLHVVWLSAGEVQYATDASGDWTFETLTSYADTGVSLALTPAGDVHVAYVWNGHGWHVTNDSGVWQLDSFDAEVGVSTSIASDAEGAAHVAYFAGPLDAPLRYAVYRPGDPRDPALQSIAGGIGSRDGGVSLAIDSAGAAHVAYPRNGIEYASDAGGGWVFEDVADDGSSPSLALDPDGGPHLAFGSVQYASRADGVWTVEDVASGFAPALAIDAEGSAHLAYASASEISTSVLHSTNRHGAWRQATVEETSFVEEGLSIAVAPDGTPHVVYVAVVGADPRLVSELHHAYPPPPDGIDQDCDGLDGI